MQYKTLSGMHIHVFMCYNYLAVIIEQCSSRKYHI
jgi:hypothetical protein